MELNEMSFVSLSLQRKLTELSLTRPKLDLARLRTQIGNMRQSYPPSRQSYTQIRTQSSAESDASIYEESTLGENVTILCPHTLIDTIPEVCSFFRKDRIIALATLVLLPFAR